MIERFSNEYVTFHCKKEEILVPRSLAEKIPKFKQMLKTSHDNTLKVDKIAHDTLDDIFRLLKHEDPIHTSPDDIQELMNAIQELGIGELAKKMKGITSRAFNPPTTFHSPSSL